MASPLAHAGTLLEGGRYQVKERAGIGGFKTVWRAYDRLRGYDVALSILHDTDGDEEIRDRFWQEAQLLQQLTLDLPETVHPFKSHVIEFLNFGELHGAPPFSGFYIVTRFLDGRTIHRMQRQHELPIPWPRAVGITNGILEALELSHTPTAHRGPILHRDIKPANVIVSADDHVTVLDFGVSKLVKSTTRAEQSKILGTLQYMAPEQLQPGARIGPATDLFAAGVILHELITGQPPWPRARLHEAMSFIAAGEAKELPPLRHLEASKTPLDLSNVIRGMLAFDIHDRPPSARIVRERLEEIRRQAELHTPTEPIDDLHSIPTLNLHATEPRLEAPSLKPSSSSSKAVNSWPHATISFTPEQTPTRPKPPPAARPARSKRVLLTVATFVGVMVSAVLFLAMYNGRAVRMTETSPSNTAPVQQVPTPSPASKPTLPPRDTPRTWLKEGNQLLFAGAFERAEKLLKRCIQTVPPLAECHRSLGVLYAMKNETKRSIRHYQRYLELRPDADDADKVRKMLSEAVGRSP